MNRRRAARPVRDVGPEPEEGRPRYASRKSGNEGLYIALGAAGVVAVVVLIIILGGSSGSEMNLEAQAFMREFLRLCIENREDQAIAMLEPREILRDQNPNDIKEWRTLSKERKTELARQSFRWIRAAVTGKYDLNLKDTKQVETILASAEYFTSSGDDRVDIQWVHTGNRWNAVLERRGEKWILLRLDRVSG